MNEADNKLIVEVSYLGGETLTREADLTIMGNLVAANTGTINLRATMKNDDYAFLAEPTRFRCGSF